VQPDRAISSARVSSKLAVSAPPMNKRVPPVAGQVVAQSAGSPRSIGLCPMPMSRRFYDGQAVFGLGTLIVAIWRACTTSHPTPRQPPDMSAHKPSSKRRTAGQSSGLGTWSGGRIVLVVGSSIAVLDGGPRPPVAD